MRVEQRMPFVGLAAGLLVLCGCATGAGQPPTTPDWFANRSALINCGTVVLEQGHVDALPQPQLECMHEGEADGGELTVTAPTTEGVRSPPTTGSGPISTVSS